MSPDSTTFSPGPGAGKPTMPTTIPVDMSSNNPPPAYLHGSRLDAADKSWHLTSPTPYDPPLTYGGFLQARQVGNQIASLLEQAKAVDASSKSRSLDASRKKRKRYKIVIHSSPFLRCVQTSLGISSGLAQTLPDSGCCSPRDLIVPRAPPQAEPQFQFKSTLLRLDSFLGEWLSPEYFEKITPPPGPALMLGGAKAELLRREDYSIYADVPEPAPSRPSSASLWQSPSASPANDPASPATEGEASSHVSALLGPARPKGYTAPRPIYAVSSSGSIPEGFVAHARDASVAVDYQWDSMRPPLDFGDGGKFGEEWASMHKRFRAGVRSLVNWYVSTDSPADTLARAAHGQDGSPESEEDDEVETVVVLVSHGAGCNALIGAITHQPVLMDIGIASITMAARKQNLDYSALLASTPAPSEPSHKTMVPVDKMYDIRLLASTEHLRRASTATTPSSARGTSAAGFWNTSTGPRGRTPTTGGPVISPFTYSDPFSSAGSRSTSASAALPPVMRRDSASHRAHLPRGPALASVGFGSNGAGSGNPGNSSPTSPLGGLWSARPSHLRLMDDGSDETDDFGSMLPDFDQKKFNNMETQTSPPVTNPEDDDRRGNQEPAASSSFGSTGSAVSAAARARARATATDDTPPFPPFSPSPPAPFDGHDSPKAPLVLSGPIKLHTNLGTEDKPVEELKAMQLGAGLGGLWGLPPPMGEAERFRDRIRTKRRWTVNERA
ncbi:hypothetical protein E4U41_003361 [Claviceps citrina]|nr:hypothetical protein E4U41_003361 [Claviceps citrina]